MSQPLVIYWSDDPDENVLEHIAEHGVTVQEAEAVLMTCFGQREPSAAETGRWVVQGYTPAGRYLMVVFDYDPELELVIPITAYEPQSE